MKNIFVSTALIGVFLLKIAFAQPAQDPWVITAPAETAFCQIDPDGKTVIPNGRWVTPVGRTVSVAPHPYGLVLSPDGSMAVTSNCGIRPLSVSVVRGLATAHPSVSQIPKGYGTDQGVLAAVYMGLAISPDNHTLYVAGGAEGRIFLFDLATEQPIGAFDCNTEWQGKPYTSSYIGDMALSKDGKLLYAVDQMNFRMLILDTAWGKLLHSVPVGRYPFGITLSPDEQTAYVANVGMYEYEIAYAYRPNDPEEKRIYKPLLGYLTEEAEKGIDTDTLKVPALGDPLAPEAFSVFAIDLAGTPHVTARIKTGVQVGELLDEVPAVGGSSPNSLVATEDYVFVSNGNNDCITIIDARADTILRELFLRPDDRLRHLRGMIPYGLALSPDQERLYVAESGINAVGVIDIPTMQVIGHIPTGWFPSKLAVTPDGKHLVVANAKGYGSGPNGGNTFDPGPEGSYIGNLMKGSVSILPVPADEELADLTQQVLNNNFRFRKASDPAFSSRKNNPIPLYPGEKPSPIKHIVFIAKENRTYDEVFGQLEGGKGDPSIARFGEDRNLTSPTGEQLSGLTISPNHLALARQFGVADNFYVDSDVSVDGQKWLLGVYPNEWAETNVVNQYGGARGFNGDTTAPGNAILAAGFTPEDYNEAGSIWDHFDRNKVPFFNFGLDLRITPYQAKAGYGPDQVIAVVNKPVPPALMRNSSHLFPSYNMRIPDQFRADVLIEEFETRWGEGKDSFPSFVTIRLPNDHGAGTRPDAGYPYRESYMMDNDLALGRIVDHLSHSPYWENMLIVITEDDAQGGVDHVDAHRSVCLVISPYIKRSHVSHVHYSFGSLMKTFWHILGVPYLNQYDASATDLADFFTDTPDFTPYEVIPVDPEVFNPELALDPFDRDFDWGALQSSPGLDDVAYIQEEREKEENARPVPFAPLIEPASQPFLKELTLTLKNVVYAADIHYTLDGSTPTPTSPRYEGPLKIEKSTVLKARSFLQDGTGSRTSTRTYTQVQPLAPVKAGKTRPGLTYQYFEGEFLQLPDMQGLRADREGTFSRPTLEGLNTRSDHFALQFNGYLSIGEAGMYTFYLSSDDGSRLYLGDTLVVDNDGSHSTRERSGKVALEAGIYPFRLDYFEDFEGQELLLEYESTNLPRQPIPNSQYSHK